MIISNSLNAQTVIAGWNLKAYGTNSNSIPGSLNATSKDPNIETPVLARGGGLTSSDVNYAYFSNVTSTSTLGNSSADAVTNGDFYTVTLKAANGLMNVTKINYQLYRSLNGPNSFRWAYSINGGTFTSVGASDVSYSSTESLGLVQTAIDLSGIVALQNVPSTSTVTFRLLGWGATTGTRRFGLGRNANASDDSFVLSFEGSLSNTLPVNLTSFTAKAQANAVQLNWQTASEQNNSHFEVLRSTDGTDFRVIGRRDGHGTTNQTNTYNFLDAKPLSGTNYYALKQYDLNGDNKQFDAISVKFSLSNNAFNAASTSSGIKVIVNSEVDESANISIFDISGKLLTSKQITLNKGVNETELANLDLAKNKLYLVKLKSANQSQTAKILK